MKKSFITPALLATVLATASPAFAGCTIGLVKASIGQTPFSQTAEMNCSDAEVFVKVLNERHNNNDNGVEPVIAIVLKQ